MIKNRVAIIIPYFGTFPVWFDLYLYSCSLQKYVDFVFFTDCDYSNHQSYENVIFNGISYEDYCKCVSMALGIDFHPDNPYKICDSRPFLGIIHGRDIVRYDWWGYADIDVIYGDLSMLVNQETLKRYDIITTHADRLAGHFTIVRKSSQYTSIGYMIENWKEKLESPLGLGVDEHDFTKVVRPGIIHLFRLYRLINKVINITQYDFFKIPNFVLSFFSKIFIKEYYTSPMPKDGEVWRYNLENCELKSPNGKQLPYLHFLFFKKTPFWSPQNYWRDGFWKVENGTRSGKVLFSNKEVIYEP